MSPETNDPTVPVRVLYWAVTPLARAELAAALSAIENVELVIVTTVDEVLEQIVGADALVLWDPHGDDAVAISAALRTSPVRWLHFISAGRERLSRIGIPPEIVVTGSEGAIAPTVAEHAMAMLLALARAIPEAVMMQARGVWDRAPAQHAFSLERRRMLVVGLGSIGREVARRATAFGMEVVGFAREARDDDTVDLVEPLVRLREHARTADVIVLSVALTAQTRGIIDAEFLARCERAPVLINVARGELVDHGALREALRSGRLAGAALDVSDPEPLPAEDPLFSMPRTLLTAHYAGGGSSASAERLAEKAVAGYRAWDATAHTVARGGQ